MQRNRDSSALRYLNRQTESANLRYVLSINAISNTIAVSCERLIGCPIGKSWYIVVLGVSHGMNPLLAVRASYILSHAHCRFILLYPATIVKLAASNQKQVHTCTVKA